MKKEKRKGSVRVVGIAIAILMIVLALILSLTGYITDYLWFKELGYTSVFFKELVTKLTLGIPTFLIGALICAAFLKFLKAGFLKKSGMQLEKENAKRIRLFGIVLSAIYSAVISGMVISELWFEMLQYFNSSDFNISDPLFNKDIGYYIFQLEFLDGLNSFALIIVAGLIIVSVIYFSLLITLSKPVESDESETYDYTVESEDPRGEAGPNPAKMFKDTFGKYIIINGKRLSDFGGGEEEQPGSGFGKHDMNGGGKDLKDVLRALISVASIQVVVLGVIFFILVAVHFLLSRYNLLYSGTGVAYGAGFTDINVTLNMYNALIVLSVVSAVLFVIAVKKKSIKLGVVGPLLMVLVVAIGTGVSGLVQNLIVSPDEINKESKYLKNNIDYTRMAYDLQDITVKDFDPDNSLTKLDVLQNMGTLSNIRINDFEPTAQYYNQTQSIRSYYTFNDVDVDRYNVNGEYTQVYLSAREIDQTKTDDQWLIRHLKYTHGYGVTLSRVDSVTGSGQPSMQISGIPPVSQVSEIQIERPEIYFGESTNSYVITNTSETEFDYPSGESNVYTTYEGDAGIKLSLINRILFALRESNIKLLVSTNIGSDSRILINRNIVDRVTKIAPFLLYDDDPYIVTADGKLYWMINAYTYSSYYPYSEPYNQYSDINYIRNSVKVVIDAYNGTTDFYICDEKDPVAQTLSKIYTDLFKPMSEMPASLSEHIQYPNALFDIQAKVYEKYHMTDVQVFYQNEDLWAIANETYGQGTKQMTSNYFIMKLPGEKDAEFVSSIPYTPTGKNNMTGLLIARSDGDKYGELILYRLPKDRTIYGPAQIEAQINQDSEISKEFSLWNNSGSTYSRGNLFVIPVENSLLYVEPIYLEASSTSLPEVKRVIMYYGDKVAYESTLGECLNKLFGPGAGDPLNTEKPIIAGEEMAQAILSGGDQPELPEPGNTDIPVDVNNPPEDGELTLEELAILADEAYNNALLAMTQGNWTEYGKYMDQLAQYLQQMVNN